LKKQIIAASVIWLSIVGISLYWNLIDEKREREKVAFETGRAFFNQIIVTRSWNAHHGGVYIPVTETSKPNPYLEDPLRDLTTDKGVKLTKTNPAYMTRQISEIAAKENNIKFHITSLNPIRPENRASDWEVKWLKSFEQKHKDQGAFITDGTNNH